MALKEKIGIVVSNKMQKTIVVKTKRYLAHDEDNQCNIGDQVLINEHRPLSKKKRWILNKIISKSSLIN